MVPVAYSCTQPITMAGAGEPAELARYRESRTGLLSSNIGEAGGFVTLDPKSPRRSCSSSLRRLISCGTVSTIRRATASPAIPAR